MTRAKASLRRTAQLAIMVPVIALVCHPSVAWAQSLGAAASFAVLAGSAVSAAGGGATVTGDVGVSPGTSITGPIIVVPPFGFHSATPAAGAAQGAATTLYNFLATAGGAVAIPDQLAGQSLPAGVYSLGAANLASGGTLTLNGGGTFIFQISSELTTINPSTVVLNGVNPCNVFWQVTSSATLGGANFPGNIVALASVTLNPGATLTGRALARTAAVTMAGGNSVGGCSGSPASGGVPAVPTLSGWALILFAGVLALGGLAAMRRRAGA